MRTGFTLMAFIIISFSTNGIAQCEHPDFEGLMEIYNALNGPNWNDQTGWEDGANGTNCDPCSWANINCIDNRVTFLGLDSDKIVGSMPHIKLEKVITIRFTFATFDNALPDFSHLKSIKNFSVGSSTLHGEIPNFSGMPTLENLYLRGNSLSGTIPDFDKLPNLEELWVGANNLVGKIPDFKHLPKLTKLRLLQNQLDGEIPNFSHLPELTDLRLDENLLTGSIPSFENIPKLEVLNLCCNKLTGVIPDFSLSKLQELTLMNNELTGSLPNFSDMESLEDLNIRVNQLSGELPLFSRCAKLSGIQLDYNMFTGTIPAYDQVLPELSLLFLNNNLLEGCFPDFICTLDYFLSYENDLMPFSGDHTEFCSAFPVNQIGSSCGGESNFGTGIIQDDCSCLLEPCDPTHPSLNTLMTFYDATNGDEWTNNTGWAAAKNGYACDPCFIHPVFGGWYGVKCNALDQIIGLDMDGLIDTTLINLPGNNLTGFLPALDLPYLEDLVLIGNNISGNIPDLDKIPMLKNLSVSFNDFTGPLPDFSNNKNIETFRGSYNQLTGPIPNLSEFSELRLYTVSNNLLEGCFPERACDIEVFSAHNNLVMPWEGDHENYCQGQSELGAPCITASGAEGFINANCECQFTISTTTFENKDIIIFPNPVGNELNILSNNNFSRYEIIDVNGVLLHSGQVNNNRIKVDFLIDGCYLLCLSSSNNKKTIHRFVK